MIHHNFKDVT